MPAHSDSTIPKGLILPKGQIISDEDNIEHIVFTIEEYRKIVHIYNGYVLYDESRDHLLRLQFLDFKLSEIEGQRLVLCLETKDDLKVGLDNMFDIWTKEHKLRLQENNRNRIREFFIGVSTGVIGLVLGTATGITIANVNR